jgi:hypothetical protein
MAPWGAAAPSLRSTAVVYELCVVKLLHFGMCKSYIDLKSNLQPSGIQDENSRVKVAVCGECEVVDSEVRAAGWVSRLVKGFIQTVGHTTIFI